MSVPSTIAPAAGTENIVNQGDSGNAPGANGRNQQPSAEGEKGGKKKVMIQGRGKGIGAVPKGRGPPNLAGRGPGLMFMVELESSIANSLLDAKLMG